MEMKKETGRASNRSTHEITLSWSQLHRNIQTWGKNKWGPSQTSVWGHIQWSLVTLARSVDFIPISRKSQVRAKQPVTGSEGRVVHREQVGCVGRVE